MNIRKTYRFRLRPSKKQAKALQSSLNACRWVYNKILEVRKQAWEEQKKSVSRYDTCNFLPEWKKENPALNNAHSQCLQNVLLRVDLAFRAFFRRVKVGEKPGFPRFKSLDRYDSFTFPQSGFTLVDDRVKLSKIGSVRIRKHREIEGAIKTLTIRRAGEKWHACFSCEVPSKLLPVIKAVVGVDVGLISFVALSTGEKIDNPRFFRTDEVKLTKAQRRFSKAEKGTADRTRQCKKVAHIHEKIANRRNDFSHKLSRRLVNANQAIVFEKLDVKRMWKNGFKEIRKSIGDIAWNQFMHFTAYKAEEAGRRVVYVDPRNTSKECSRCGQLVEKKLSDRVHNCPFCGLILDRDHNASINILRRGMPSLASA